jgi:hypothetical protein
MGVGADIKEALQEVGVAYTIERTSGENVTGEYGLLEFSAQVTKPLTIEHFRRGMTPYDTELSAGDVVSFDVISETFLATNMLPELFENEVAHYDTVFYKCNITSGELMRPSGETWDDPANLYHKETEWETVQAGCKAMQVAALYGNDMETDEEVALIGLKKDEVLIPHSLGAQVMDRWQPTSGEYYQVNVIETRRYPNIDVLIVEEDQR